MEMVNQGYSLLTPQMTELPFVGRGKEIRELIGYFNSALDYQGRVVLILGEAGTGKTRLMEEFAHLPELSGVIKLRGKCFKEEVEPFNPFPKVVISYLESTDRPSYWATRLIDREVLPYLLTVIPDLKSYYPFEVNPNPPPKPQVIYNCFSRIFDNLASFSPLVLFIDDAFWMGRETLKLLEFISFQLSGKPILIVATARPYKEDSDFDRFLSKVAERRLLSVIELGNLGERDMEELLKLQFGSEPQPNFNEWLYHISKGNPLFVSEILKTLLHRNILQVHKRGYEIIGDYQDIPLSRSIESIIGLELQGLKLKEREILQKAAVIGEEVEIFILRKLLPNFSDREFSRFLHRMKMLHILEEKGADLWQFTHPLLRKVLYQGMKRDLRRRVHRKVANVLRRVDKNRIEEIAYHLIQDLEPSEGNLRTCQDILKAARVYKAKRNYREAKKYYELAQRIGEKVSGLSERLKLVIQASKAEISFRLGEPIESCNRFSELAEEVKEAGLKESFSLLSILAFCCHTRQFQYEEAKAILEKAIQVCQSSKKRRDYYKLRIRMAAHLVYNMSDYKKGEEELLKLLKEVKPDAYPDIYWDVISGLGTIYRHQGDFEKAMELLKESLEFSKRLSIFHRIESLPPLGILLTEMGESKKAKEYFETFLNMAQYTGDQEYISKVYWHLGNWYLYQGQYSEALRYYRGSLSIAQTLNIPEGILANRQRMVETFLRLGDLSHAEKEMRELVEFTRVKNFPKRTIPFTFILKSYFYFEKGDFLEALSCAEDALRVSQEMGFKTQQGEAGGWKSLCLLKLGREEEAVKYFQKARKSLHQQKAFSRLSDLLIRFGFTLRGREGEEVVLEGMEILSRTGAVFKIEHLLNEVRKARFTNALERIEGVLNSLHQEKRERLRIHTFGGLFVVRPPGYKPISHKEWQTRKTKELLGLFIVLKEATLERFASYLWPEASSKKAKNNFYVTLNRLKRALKKDCINFNGTFYSLNRDSIWVDCWEFEELYRRFLVYKKEGKLHRAEQIAYKAVELYSGDFLPEVYLLPIDDKQIELKEKVKFLLSWLSRRALDRLEYQESLNLIYKFLSIDPLNEQAHQLIMETLSKQGDKTAALKHFERLKSLLKRELDTEPSPETVALYETLKGKK